ncbi:hypothetical protein [Streptomyces sp. NPDC002769]|uniref:hypothetical protein n=1 Tax=Streptomyces sp. NPDC002769 TaxID=3154542 RepID=UPI00332E5615
MNADEVAGQTTGPQVGQVVQERLSYRGGFAGEVEGAVRGDDEVGYRPRGIVGRKRFDAVYVEEGGCADTSSSMGECGSRCSAAISAPYSSRRERNTTVTASPHTASSSTASRCASPSSPQITMC